MKKYLIGIILTIFLAAPLAAQTDEPLDVIKKNVDNVLNVLRDPALQEASAATKKKEALRSISDEMFNWPLLSRYVLSRNWRAFNSDQQSEFVTLFKEILEQTYMDRILAYKDEKIEYAGNRMLSNNKAEVETRIYTGTAPIILTYRLALMNGKWAVYEVNADGISMTQTFRDDYRIFLHDNSPDDLLAELRKKAGGAGS